MIETLLKFTLLVLDMETTKVWSKNWNHYNVIGVCCNNTTGHLIVIINNVKFIIILSSF